MTIDWISRKKKLQEGKSGLPFDKPYAKPTLENRKRVRQRWDNFHRRELNEDPDEALSNLKHNVDNVKLFLDSIVHDGIARKNPGLPVDDLLESEAEGSSEPETPKKLMYKSTVDQIYKYLQMCYFQHTGEKMLPRHNAEIHNYIEGEMRKNFNLIVAPREKPVCTSVDLHTLLQFIWCFDTTNTAHLRYMVQLALICELAGYTSTRIGTMVVSSCYKGENDCLRYKDFQLSLLRNPVKEEGDVLVLEVTLTLQKGGRDGRIPVTFVLHEVQDNPVFCPLLSFLALAFADNVFANESIRTPEDLLSLRVEDEQKSKLVIPWKKSARDQPIFRRVEKGEVHVSSTQGLTFEDFNYQIKRAGMLAGFPKPLNSYDLRRGAANAVDNPSVTEAQRMQIMSHSRSSTFRYYIQQTVQVDTQSMYLGTPTRKDLIVALSRMSSERDSGAPTKPSAVQLQEISENKILRSLQREREKLKIEIKSSHSTISKAKGTPLHEKYLALSNTITKQRKLLTRDALKKGREQFFENVHLREIDRQLSGESSKLKPLVKEKPSFSLPARTRIAETFLGHREMSRAQLIEDMAWLCCNGTKLNSYHWNDQTSGPIDGNTLSHSDILCCAFCISDLTMDVKYRPFATKMTLKRHVHHRHLPEWIETRRQCPYALCTTILENMEHLQNHFASVHLVEL